MLKLKRKPVATRTYWPIYAINAIIGVALAAGYFTVYKYDYSWVLGVLWLLNGLAMAYTSYLWYGYDEDEVELSTEFPIVIEEGPGR
jgi:hypothetical protein